MPEFTLGISHLERKQEKSVLTANNVFLRFISLIDCFMIEQSITSLSLSPTGNFLATSHVDDLGVYLWSNKTLYSHVPLRPLPADYEPQVLDMPATAIDKTCGHCLLFALYHCSIILIVFSEN